MAAARCPVAEGRHRFTEIIGLQFRYVMNVNVNSFDIAQGFVDPPCSGFEYVRDERRYTLQTHLSPIDLGRYSRCCAKSAHSGGISQKQRLEFFVERNVEKNISGQCASSGTYACWPSSLLASSATPQRVRSPLPRVQLIRVLAFERRIQPVDDRLISQCGAPSWSPSYQPEAVTDPAQADGAPVCRRAYPRR